MAVQNIDVIGSSTDSATTAFRQALSSRIDADFVQDMVNAILRRLGRGNEIGRLRIFGHAMPGGLQLSGYSASSPCHIRNPRVTGRTALTKDSRRIIMGNLRRVTNDWELHRLNGRFAAYGWVELHGCDVASRTPGHDLLQALARILLVLVKGGTGDQIPGGIRRNSLCGICIWWNRKTLNELWAI